MILIPCDRSPFHKVDILSIPGSAVVVERIFLGGRDTISLRRASLHANTIRILMIVKSRVCVVRAKSA
ncbi:hypothetical protein L208DRAFT_1418364, partial [Tricholoma matsutake]